jgi:hypothetical protein
MNSAGFGGSGCEPRHVQLGSTDVATMVNLLYKNHCLFGQDLVKNPIISDPNSMDVLFTPKLYGATRKWVVSKFFKLFSYPSLGSGVERISSR